MNLTYIPDIENIVLKSCKGLMDQCHFSLFKKSKNDVSLLSEKCGIRIMAGISPIGERQIELDFFNPNYSVNPEYYSHTFLLYLSTRLEPRDVIRTCHEEVENFDESLSESLKCFTSHTLKYRQDILSGDFTSWLPNKLLE